MKQVARWLALALVVIAFAACHAGVGPARPSTTAPASCRPDALAACEAEIEATLSRGDDASGLVRSYAAARAAKHPGDALPTALDAASKAALSAKAKGGLVAALAIEEGARDPGVEPDLVRFQIPALEPERPAGAPLLYAALAEVSGLELLAVVRRDGSLVRAFGRDPLAPWMAGLLPTVIDTRPQALANDVAIERELRGALASAGARDFVAASDRVDALESLVRSEDAFDAAALRASVALDLLSLGAPEPLFADGARTPADPPPPAATETPYYDLLRVRAARFGERAFEPRRERILAASPPELRPSIERTFGDPARVGCATVLPPSFERPRDLGFAFLLPAALAPASARDARGRLTLFDWYPRYEKLVSLVDRTHTAFAVLRVLASERGGKSSITPRGSTAYAAVDKMIEAQARALAILARERPGRVGIAQLALASTPAAYDSEGGKRALLDLVRTTASGSLRGATDGWDLLTRALTNAFVSGSLPQDARREHLESLARAFSDALSGPLREKTGWGVAVAYALDFGYRARAGLGTDAKTSVAQIARALESDPKIAQPALASLVSALGRYASLREEDGLGEPFLEHGASPRRARAQARASLTKALGELGDSPDPKLLAELGELFDNAAATLAFAVGAPKPERAPAPKTGGKRGRRAAADTCEDDEAGPLDPRLGRALSKLRDERQRVLRMPALEGPSTFAKRAHLVVALVSDGIDVASAREAAKKKPKAGGVSFAIGREESLRIARDAIATFAIEPELASAIGRALAIARGLFGEGPSFLTGAGRSDLAGLLASARELLADPSSPRRAGGLISLLTAALGGEEGGFVEVARAAFERGDADQGDMILLGALLASTATGQPVPEAARGLARDRASKTAWLFDFTHFAKPSATAPPSTPSFKPGLDALLEERCATASTTTMTEVLDALERFRRGDRDAARASLEATLERTGHELDLPHVAFRLGQRSRSRVLSLSLDVGLAQPFASENQLDLSAGFSTGTTSSFSLTVDVDERAGRRDAAAYYVHASAVLAALHFLAGDPVKAERAAARALGVVVQRTAFAPDGPFGEAIAKPAAGTLAIVAQQAIDAGRPLLAGALLQIVRSTFDEHRAKARDLAALLSGVPKPLVGIAGLDDVLARAKTTLERLGAGFDCVGPKIDRASILEPTCEAYPEAIALRVADATASLPKLAGGRGKARGSCPDSAALDAFLVGAQSGKYDPDRLLEAVDRLLERDKAFDASFLLTRTRDPGHCSERVVRDLRLAAERLEGVPTSRADLLTAVVNCEAGAPVSVLSADLVELDRALDAVGDPARQIQIGFFAASVAQRRAEPSIAAAVVKKPDFVSKHRKDGLVLALALLLDHLASALAGDPPDADGTRRDMELVCGSGDQPAGPDVCRALASLRAAGLDASKRKRLAEEILAKLGPRK